MTDRGAAPSDRATACPFVAFDDDRDERADRPDHRHRCYAEVRPAPRALAHQESYCLSPRFPTCPTFQDWARREAAQARGAAAGRSGSDARAGRISEGDAGAAALGTAAADDVDAPAVEAVSATGAADEGDPADQDGEAPDPYDDDLGPRSRQQRDWAAPPPWVAGRADRGDRQGTDPIAAAGAGLATSRWLADAKPGDIAAGSDGSLVGAAQDDGPFLVEATPRPELAGLVGRQPRPGRETATDRARRERPVVGQARPLAPSARARDQDDPTPAWERPRRFEAYPSIRSRVVMPSVPRAALGVVALLVAALALFTLPALFLSRNDPAALASGSPGSSPSVSLAPTPTPAATPLTYTVKPNDTLTKIAQKFKVTQAAILKANPNVKDANLIAVGQVLIIPTPPPPDVIRSSAGASASPSASAP